jgi:hypothetical protein
MSPKVEEVLDEYQDLSKCVCITCGKINVPMTDFGWVSPLCKECYEEEFKWKTKPYEEIVTGQYEIPERFRKDFETKDTM